MRATTRKRARTVALRRHLSTTARLLTFSTVLFTAGAGRAQLPAGTTDTTQTPAQGSQDPLRVQASDALQKGDYTTALKLLTALAEKNPNDAQILYNLASTQE